MDSKEKSLNQIWKQSGKPGSFKDFATWWNSTQQKAVENPNNIIQVDSFESAFNPGKIKVDESNVISEIGEGDNVWVAVAVGVAMVAGIYLLMLKKEE